MFNPRKLLSCLAAALLSSKGLARSTDGPAFQPNVGFYQPTDADMAMAQAKFLQYQSRSLQSPSPQPALPKTVLLTNASTGDLARAKALVDSAIKQQGEFNLWRLSNPHRGGKQSRETGQSRREDAGNGPSPPELTPDLLKAIKLTNDAGMQELHNNGTLQRYHEALDLRGSNLGHGSSNKAGNAAMAVPAVWDKGDWMAMQNHSFSRQPFQSDPNYKVWRNVKDYGAVGDGVTDDTDAIQKAISDGNRCGKDCPGSTITGAIVYFPSGIYRVDRTIVLYYNTQLVGNVDKQVATIQSAPNFIGFGLFTTDVYLADGHSEWYLNTANFYRSIRGINIDTQLTVQSGMVAIHWQVAQATTLEDIHIMMSNSSSTTQVGIFAENGSGGWMGDLTIQNGEYGILAGSQQYSASRIAIYTSKKCIGLIWNWVWSWSHLHLEHCQIGIDLTAPGSDPKNPVGSLSIVDSTLTNCNTAIKTYPFSPNQTKEQGSTVIALSHSTIQKSTTFIGFPDGSSIARNVDAWTIDYWQYGNEANQGSVVHGEFTTTQDRPASLLDESGNWFSTGKPNFYAYNSNQIVNARIFALGDGKQDDSIALQIAVKFAAVNQMILYIPAGVYIVTRPIMVPNNSRIRGEVWSQIMAAGSAFASASSPTPMFFVGQGETDGLVQMENLLFTSKGSLPGLILVQWNIRSNSPGNVGMWVTMRFTCKSEGSAQADPLQESIITPRATKANCPKLSGQVDNKCIAGTMMLQVSSGASGYFENMWAWVADHDIDDPAKDDANQINVYFARGVSIQGQGPNWFRGTASEHSILYQYNVAGASNVYMSIIQTESPYYQGTSFLQAPGPFKGSPVFNLDPSFGVCGAETTNCNAAWALMIQNSDGVFVDGAGLYSWFQNYNQDCVDKKNCQQRLIYIYNSANVFLSHLVTIGSVEVVTPAISNLYNDIIYAENSLEATGFPWWTTVGSYLDSNIKINVTDRPYPIKKGWVSFGDSYAAGIGAGKPWDTLSKCTRGTGSYPAILDHIIRATHQFSPVWQMYACSGETASQFLNGGGINQLSQWFPSTSDIATVSFTGNDLGFGDIVAHCIMGFWSRANCENDIQNAERILEGALVQELVHDVLDAIFNKQGVSPRFVVYWTGYPQFFAVDDFTCDTSYFREAAFAGEYLVRSLRLRLNELSAKVNTQIEFAIDRYNVNLKYVKAVFLDLDEDYGIYAGQRFCEAGVVETLKGQQDQNTVAFFYDNGYDDIPSETEGFNLPPSSVNDAPSDWPWGVTSSLCSDVIDVNQPLDAMLCYIAKDIANGTLTVADYQKIGGPDAGQVVQFADGSVLITAHWTAFKKMFHPKTRANWHIAQAILDKLLLE